MGETGRLAGSQGAYYLSGSGSLSLYGGNIQLGFEGNGSFTQNGGTVLLESPNGNAGHVIIANAPSASGNYTLNGGNLTALSVRVGGDVSSAGGPGALTVNGGTVKAALQVWNNGTVTLNNGIINVGSDPLADNIRNDGLIINNGGSLIVGGRIYGTGEIVQSSGAASFADQAVIDTGGVTIAGGAATAAASLLVGRNIGAIGILNVTGDSGGTHTGEWMVDNFAVAGTVDEAHGQISSTAAFSSPGVYLVKLTVIDACSNSSTTSTVNGLPAMLVIYDPNAGFVTGGGWFNSAAGSYAAQPALTGKASFGFVSKYKKGQTVPTGETEFQFQVANFNFHSTSYDWLVAAGARAQYKGSGTVNNAGSYGFILTAIDGAVKGGGGVDKFRIKITDKSTGAVVYDNQFGASDGADPSTAISGGSIVLQAQ